MASQLATLTGWSAENILPVSGILMLGERHCRGAQATDGADRMVVRRRVRVCVCRGGRDGPRRPRPPRAAATRIICCADGTWYNADNKTNVYTFYKALKTTARQLPFYDDGVGADGNGACSAHVRASARSSSALMPLPCFSPSMPSTVWIGRSHEPRTVTEERYNPRRETGYGFVNDRDRFIALQTRPCAARGTRRRRHSPAGRARAAGAHRGRSHTPRRASVNS
jgi:hypothetical protein